jgi:serine protease Do
VDPGAGALVNSVAAEGPGAKAQLRPGDVVAAVNGKRVRDAQELIRELLAHDVGQTVSLEVIRAGKHYATKAELTARPEAPLAPAPVQQQSAPSQGLGLSLRELSPDQSVQLGLPPRPITAVALVAPGSPGDRAGLRAGDVVIEADGMMEPSAAQIAQAGSDGHMLLRVRRRDAAFYAAVHR